MEPRYWPFFLILCCQLLRYGFYCKHWDHHRYTNQKNDPDLIPTAHLTSWWQRLLLSRLIFNVIYMKYTLTMALGKLNLVEKYQTP